MLAGRARVSAEGRSYILEAKDCLYLPANVPHAVVNEDPNCELLVLRAMASASATREPGDKEFPAVDRGFGNSSDADPEIILCFAERPIYEIAPGAFFCDLFANRFGSVGICGGYGRFAPGASLPCHTHDFDESITIIQGKARCRVQGRRHDLTGCDTAFIPSGVPHRFLNTSDEEMAIIWVYAGNEPEREIIDDRLCSQ